MDEKEAGKKQPSLAGITPYSQNVPQIPSIEEEGSIDQSQMQHSIMPAESFKQGNPQGSPSPATFSENEQNYAPDYSPQYPEQNDSQEMIPSAIPQSQNPMVQEYRPEPPQGSYEDYQPYQSYSSGTSPDIISEISDQIISEKLSTIRTSIEKAINVRNNLGTKLDYLEERLKRIEKIIDTLQSSVLRRVGDYVNDVQEIKKELIETEKTLSKVIPSMKKTHRKKKK